MDGVITIDLVLSLFEPARAPPWWRSAWRRFRMIACCAPAYLRGRRAPGRPRDLADHACLVYGAPRTRDE